MSNKLGRHLFKHGLFSGYTEYRYSSEPARRVTLAPIFNEARRDSLADRVAEIMEEAPSSVFQFEGVVRQQLRSSLCLEGNSWARSDAEAAGIVEKALKNLGAERPSIEEAQPDHAGGTDYCSWCACPIDDEGRTRGQRFCSVVCASAASVQRERRLGAYQGMVMRAAARLIARSKVPPRPCQHCGTMFQNERETAIYCSPRCTSHASYGDRLVPDIVCEACGKVAKPANRGARFCSLECRSSVAVVERREKLADVVRQCAECGTGFSPKSERDRHCSQRCASKERNRLYKARGGLPSAYTYTCQCCGVGFTSRQPKAPFCGKPCKDVVDRVENGKAKRISPRVFDYVLRMPPTTAMEMLFGPG